jgi:hypothetical protein
MTRLLHCQLRCSLSIDNDIRSDLLNVAIQSSGTRLSTVIDALIYHRSMTLSTTAFYYWLRSCHDRITSWLASSKGDTFEVAWRHSKQDMLYKDIPIWLNVFRYVFYWWLEQHCTIQNLIDIDIRFILAEAWRCLALTANGTHCTRPDGWVYMSRLSVFNYNVAICYHIDVTPMSRLSVSISTDNYQILSIFYQIIYNQCTGHSFDVHIVVCSDISVHPTTCIGLHTFLYTAVHVCVSCVP